MTKENNIRRFTAAELRERVARGEDRTDWERVRAKTEADIARDIADDPDWRDVPHDWYLTAELVMPGPKKLLSLRVDVDIIEWFKQQGPGYQTRMNAALKAYMNARKKTA